MYSVEATGAHILLTYSEVFQDKRPDLLDEIKKLNMHKAISIICELIRVRDEHMEPIKTLIGEIMLPFEIVLKKEMCDIVPASPEEMETNAILRKDIHIISVQMLFILLKYIIIYGNYETFEYTDYQICKEDYKTIIKLQLVVAEDVSNRHKKEINTDHFLYSTYHFNYQKNMANEFLRMYYMMEVISQNRNNFEDDVKEEYRDYYKDFTEKYSFTPTEYSSILFWQLNQYYSGINGLTCKSIWKSIEESYGSESIKQIASKIIVVLSKSISEYRTWAEKSKDFEWDFSDFFSFPFIEDTTKKFISLSDITLRNAFFEKLFWLIRDCYPKNDSRAMSFFGRLYEKYIQDITKNAAKDKFVYIDEFEFGTKKENKKSSDAYVRKEKEVLIVEAKGFSVLLDCMIKNEKVEDNNKKLFVNPVLQADSCFVAVADTKPEFKDIESAYIVAVTMDNINAIPNYYNAIHKEIVENKKSCVVKYFFNLNIEEYEMLMYLMEQGHDIFLILREYFKNNKLKPFSSYVLEKYTDIGMTNFMEHCYKNASDKMKTILFGENN